MTKWKDKREVMYKTTEYENEEEIFTKRRRIEVRKPLPMIKMNTYKSDNDHQDQLLSYYPCQRTMIQKPFCAYCTICHVFLNKYN